MHHTLTAVLTTVAGHQDGVLDARFAATENRHIQVQSGIAWVSCFDLPAVASHAGAWNAARDAGKHLPEQINTPKTDLRMVGSAIIRARGPVKPELYEAFDIAPYLEVRVGPLRTRAYDQAAITSLADTWSRATNLALALWTGRSDIIDSPAVADLITRAGIQPTHHRGAPRKP
jgi:hypothetical protein